MNPTNYFSSVRQVWLVHFDVNPTRWSSCEPYSVVLVCAPGLARVNPTRWSSCEPYSLLLVCAPGLARVCARVGSEPSAKGRVRVRVRACGRLGLGLGLGLVSALNPPHYFLIWKLKTGESENKWPK